MRGVGADTDSVLILLPHRDTENTVVFATRRVYACPENIRFGDCFTTPPHPRPSPTKRDVTRLAGDGKNPGRSLKLRLTLLKMDQR